MHAQRWHILHTEKKSETHIRIYSYICMCAHTQACVRSHTNPPTHAIVVAREGHTRNKLPQWIMPTVTQTHPITLQSLHVYLGQQHPSLSTLNPLHINQVPLHNIPPLPCIVTAAFCNSAAKDVVKMVAVMMARSFQQGGSKKRCQGKESK